MHLTSLFKNVAKPGAVLIVLLSNTANAEFYLTRDQNPFSLFQGQPLPLSAKQGSESWVPHFSIDITNTLNAQVTNNQSLYVDFESYYLNTRLSRAFGQHWSLAIDLPLISRAGGFLDGAIDGWHDVFDLPQANRPNTPRNQYTISYTQNGSNRVQITDKGRADIGDIATHVGYHTTYDSIHVALWAGLELPTGNRLNLSGNDKIDVHVTVAAASQPHPDWWLAFNVGAVLPGGDLISSNPNANSVLFTYIATRWQALDWLQLKLQLESHQAYFENDALDLMDKASILVFGISLPLDNCNRFDFGVSEDIDVGASPDVSFLFSFQHKNC